MTPASVIAEVRPIIQDTLAPYRYSDAVLLGFFNQILKRMVPYRPDLFMVNGSVSVTADNVLQSLPSSAVRLVEVYQVVGGDALTEVNRETLDQMYPGWRVEASGTPVNFMRHPRSPNKFFLYPRPTSGITILVEYVNTPTTYNLNDTVTELPDTYLPMIVDGVVYMAEAVNAESVANGRAKFYLDSFLEALGVELGTRALVDSESGAVGMQASRRSAQEGQGG